MVLEDIESAENRGAKILAKIKGYGTAFNPGKARNSEESAVDSKRSVELALKDASLRGGRHILYLCMRELKYNRGRKRNNGH